MNHLEGRAQSEGEQNGRDEYLVATILVQNDEEASHDHDDANDDDHIEQRSPKARSVR